MNKNNLTVEKMQIMIGSGIFLNNISFTAKSKEITSIYGASGCGKTTIIRAIGNALSLNISVNGIMYYDNNKYSFQKFPWDIYKFPIVYQDPMNTLNPVLTVGRYLYEISRAHNPKESRQFQLKSVEEVLDEVRLPNDKQEMVPGRLSGGERQKVLIAGVLLANPSIILADEPTASLDVIAKHEIMKLIAEIACVRNIPVLLVTHDIPLSVKYAQNIYHLKNGIMYPENKDKLVHDCFQMKRIGKDNNEIVLSISNISKRFKDKKILKNISFELSRGDVLGITGRSGCGKTTFARIVSGLDFPNSGTVYFRTRSKLWLKKSSPDSAIQLIFQEPYASFDPRQTLFRSVKDGLKYSGDVLSSKTSEYIYNSLQSVGICRETANRLPRYASGGECQRVAIVRSLLCAPSILIADEPTSSLDYQSECEILNMLQRSIESGVLAIVVISHDISLLSRFCTKMAVISKGEIIEFGLTQELIDNPQTHFSRELIAASNITTNLC